MKKIKSLLAEFKAFISRGNVVDMAVAVIIGAAFGAIVTAMTNGIIKPLVDWAMCGISGDASGLITVLKPVFTQVPNPDYVEGAAGVEAVITILDKTKSIYIDWGTFIMKVIDFFIIAIVLFAIIKVFMGLKNAATKAQDKAKEKIAKKLKKQGMSEEEAAAQAEAQVAAEETPAAPAAPTTEELLLQIRDLLAAQNKGAQGETESGKE